MRNPSFAQTERDEGGLTAVIEFLSAFTLFLMILTAFLSLAQLQMGSNDPDVDRLDRAAAVGLDRLTSGPGWFVPMDGGLDYGNGGLASSRCSIPRQRPGSAGFASRASA
jgi:hypothetical protein